MTGFLKKLLRDARGVTIVEFAIAAPVAIVMLVGAVQIGSLMLADANMRHALGEGARFLKVNPTATTAQVTTVIEGAYAGLDSANVTDLDIEPGTDANGAAFADLSMRYDIDLQFVLFQLENIELEANRRVFLQL